MRLRSVLAFVLVVGCSSSSESTVIPAAASEPAQAASPGGAGAPSVTETPPSEPADGKTLRTLIIGNSQIYFWDLPKLLADLSETAPRSSPHIAADGFTRGGANLEKLWEDGASDGRDLATTIAEGHYDVVVIAESIDLVEQPPPIERFEKYAGMLIDAARAAHAVPVLYATPYPDQEEHWGFREMAEPQLAFGAKREVSVAAGGLAWLRVWQELPEIDLHATDHAHPGYKGSVISAMVLYSVITHATAMALDPKLERSCGEEACPAVSPGEAAIFQSAAWAEAEATGL
jgi:hypothetical protein